MVEQCKPWASVATRKRVWSVTLMQTLHPIPSSKSISIGPNFYWLIFPIVDGGSIRPPILLPCLPRSFSPIGQWALQVIRLKAKSIMARSVAGPPMKWEIKRDLAFFTWYLQVIHKTFLSYLITVMENSGRFIEFGNMGNNLMLHNQFKAFSINLNVQHVNGMTHFDLAIHSGKY